MDLTRACKAFSLVELLVVISIFSLISLVILANHSRFNSSVLLTSLSYDIALSIRQAQVYGLSVRGFDPGTGVNTFQVGYGLRFNSTGSYTFFADTNKSKTYDSGDTVLSTYTLSHTHSIKRFCATTAEQVEVCSDSGALPELDVVFYRPDPDAIISAGGATRYSSAKIVVTSGSQTRTVVVASTGQISVQNP